MKVEDDTVYPMVDFSYWNTADQSNDPTPTLDVQKLISLDIKGAIVRAGKGAPELGSDFGIDRHFYQNVDSMDQESFPWMPYWRIYDIWYDSPEAQAALFIEALGNTAYATKSRGPIWIDAEEYVASGGVILGPRLITHWLKSFMGVLTAAGYRHIGFYTRANWWSNNVLPFGNMTGYPLWIAHWIPSDRRAEMLDHYPNSNTWDEYVAREMRNGPALPMAWHDWDIWQFIGEGSRMGVPLGFASEHLDCNLIKETTYNRWFG